MNKKRKIEDPIENYKTHLYDQELEEICRDSKIMCLIRTVFPPGKARKPEKYLEQYYNYLSDYTGNNYNSKFEFGAKPKKNLPIATSPTPLARSSGRCPVRVLPTNHWFLCPLRTKAAAYRSSPRGVLYSSAPLHWKGPLRGCVGGHH